MSDACCGTTCEAPAGSASGCEGRCECPCGTPGCGGDPMDCATGMWTGSFFQAMKALQVEYLKAKIQKAWGSKMDKAADAVLEAMGTHWQAMVAQAQSKETLRSKLQGLWQEGQK